MSILYPTDFSDNSVQAFEYAYNLAKGLNTSITVLHVYPVPLSATFDDAGVADVSLEMINATENAMEQRLQQFKEEIKAKYNRNEPDSIRVDTMLRMGLIGEQVAHVAEEIHASHIIISAHEISGVERVLFGSSTMAILRKSHIPVITIPENFIFNGIKTIAYATDLTFSDTDIIAKLLELATVFNAQLKCFHVHNSNLEVENSIIQDFITQYKSEANAGLVTFQLIDNISTIDGIDYFVKEYTVDLLCVVKQKHYWIDIFESSTTKKLLFHEEIPLLVFHD